MKWRKPARKRYQKGELVHVALPELKRQWREQRRRRRAAERRERGTLITRSEPTVDSALRRMITRASRRLRTTKRIKRRGWRGVRS